MWTAMNNEGAGGTGSTVALGVTNVAPLTTIQTNPLVAMIRTALVNPV